MAWLALVATSAKELAGLAWAAFSNSPIPIGSLVKAVSHTEEKIWRLSPAKLRAKAPLPRNQRIQRDWGNPPASEVKSAGVRRGPATWKTGVCPWRPP